MKKYIKPIVEEKSCEISYFLSNNFFSDALGFFVGDVVYAQSGWDGTNCGGDSGGSNCNNSSCDLGSDGGSSNNNDNSSYDSSTSSSDSSSSGGDGW